MRQFVASTVPNKKGHLALSEKEKRYLISVLRIKMDEEILVRLPDGSTCRMRVQFESEGKKKVGKAYLSVCATLLDSANQRISCSTQEGVEYWLFQFLPKGQKMDTIVRQATECGASAIVPIVGEYSVTGKKTEFASEYAPKVDRWTRIVREAQQQSGSAVKTAVFSPCSITDAMNLWNDKQTEEKKETMAFVLCEKSENHLSVFSHMKKIKDVSNIRIGFAVGCEGGISSLELTELQKNSFTPIHLKTNILRAETAALYSFAVLQSIVGEYDIWKGLKE